MKKPEFPRVECAKQPQRCPACDAPSVARIVYGHPLPTERLTQDLAEGKVVDGGCILTGDDPIWKCTTCGQPIHREKPKRSILHN
jgi:hypothetical protein